MSDLDAKHDPTQWREVYSTDPGNSYAHTIEVSDDGAVKIDVGGVAVIRPSLKAWVEAVAPELYPVAPPLPAGPVAPPLDAESVSERVFTLARKLNAAERQRNDLLAVLKHITDRAGRRGILTLSTFDLASMRDAIAQVERAEPYPPFEGTDVMDGDEDRS
jgi:hypothetical protein